MNENPNIHGVLLRRRHSAMLDAFPHEAAPGWPNATQENKQQPIYNLIQVEGQKSSVGDIRPLTAGRHDQVAASNDITL